MADLIVPINIPKPNTDAWTFVCENLSYAEIGILAWLYYAHKDDPNTRYTISDLDPNCEPGVEEAIISLSSAGYIRLEERE